MMLITKDVMDVVNMEDDMDDVMDDVMNDVTWTHCHPPLPGFLPLHYPRLAQQTSPQVVYPPADQKS